MMRGPNRVREAFRLLEEKGWVRVESTVGGDLTEVRLELDHADEPILTLFGARTVATCSAVFIP